MGRRAVLLSGTGEGGAVLCAWHLERTETSLPCLMLRKPAVAPPLGKFHWQVWEHRVPGLGDLGRGHLPSRA